MTAVGAVLARLTTPRDAALTATLIAFAVWETLAWTDAPAPAVRALLAAATLLGLALRRTHPLLSAAMVASGLLAESIIEPADEVAVLLGVIVAAFSVATYAPLRDALVGAVLLSMAVATAITVDPSDTESNILPTLMLFIVVPVALGVTVNRRTQEVERLRVETTALARAADEAVDAERRRIARELHDVVSHAVTLIAVQAEAGRSLLDTDGPSARRSLEAIGEVSRDALAELDRLLAVLRDDAPDEDHVGLAHVGTLVTGARAAGLDVEVEEVGTPVALPVEADRCAYRVVQEGLTNALRHSSGGSVRVLLTHVEEGVRVRVESTGTRHVSAYGGTGRGLAGLRERVVGLGG